MRSMLGQSSLHIPSTSSRDIAKAAPIGLRHYATEGNKKKLNTFSSIITQPKSQGASQAMCKFTFQRQYDRDLVWYSDQFNSVCHWFD